MKIAITGKGGVGKTTLSSALCHIFASEGKRVIAVDADPDANLPQALGLSPSTIATLKPITEMKDLIEQRTGAKAGSYGGVFKLNPRVDDLPEKIGYQMGNITLLLMGSFKSASSGCYCPENVLLKRLLKHLVVDRDEVVIVDMEAGIEHMTRGTAEAVTAFIVVVEPGSRSIQTAMLVKDMAKAMGVLNVFVVANKVRGEADINYIKSKIADLKLLGTINYDSSLVDADIAETNAFKPSSYLASAVKAIKEELLKHYIDTKGSF